MLNTTKIKCKADYWPWILIFVFSLWLRSAFPIFAIADAGHDDQLFIRLAEYIYKGGWLGVYDNLTLAKGAGYPIFIALNDALNLPLKMTEHFLYLVVAAFFSSVIAAHFRLKKAGVFVFAILAFIPTAWDAGTGARVMRENLYITLSLLLITLSIRLFIDNQYVCAKEAFRKKTRLLVAFGLTAGLYWLTREEGVWLVPAVSILVAYWLWINAKHEPKWLLCFILLPITVFYLVIGVVNSVNYHYYGVFRNNDFRSSDFQSAYGAISRIKHEHWRRYVIFPADARAKAYAVSSAAGELKSALEGEIGERWRHRGCQQTATEPCPEILSGWFMWALRDAVAQAGYYRSARDAQAFYQRLAAEINQACDNTPGLCLPERSTMVPPWRWHYLPDTLGVIGQLIKNPSKKTRLHTRIPDSFGHEENLRLFERRTQGPLSSRKFEQAKGANLLIQRGLADRIGQWQTQLMLIGLPCALGLWIILTIKLILRSGSLVHWIVMTTMWTALLSRTGLLAFLEATSIPSINLLYFMPVLPIVIALFPCTLLWLIASYKKT